MSRSLTRGDLAAAAAALGCDLATVEAVVQVESSGRGFDPASGRPLILFEPHWFSRLTAGRFDADHPTLSYPRWGTRPYPPRQAERWCQLEAAAALDRDAAYGATSWGLFQILGVNHALCGFARPTDFAAGMAESEGRQLAAFVAFVLAKGLDRALRARDWSAFARAYNGPSFAKHDYHGRLARAWERARQKHSVQS